MDSNDGVSFGLNISAWTFFTWKEFWHLQLVLKYNSVIMKSIGRINFKISMNEIYFMGGMTQFLCIILVSSSIKD
jgi:hypothetical protein